MTILVAKDGKNVHMPTVTFGGLDVYGAVAAVARRSIKGAFFHKWRVHLRLRPEEFGLKLDNIRMSGDNKLSLHGDILNNTELLRRIEDANYAVGEESTWLLGQAFPEGSPTHPAYPSGHATIAGACSTVMKAFFNEATVLYEPGNPGNGNIAKVPRSDGSELVDWDGPDTLTLGGEIDKLASNIAYGRQSAGVHYRSDSDGGLQLGESVALEYLLDLLRDHPEPGAAFHLTLRSGEPCLITPEGVFINEKAYL